MWRKRAIITPIWISSRLSIISQCHRWNICIALIIDSLNTVKRPCAQFKEIQLMPQTSWRGALEKQSDISKGSHRDLRGKKTTRCCDYSPFLPVPLHVYSIKNKPSSHPGQKQKGSHLQVGEKSYWATQQPTGFKDSSAVCVWSIFYELPINLKNAYEGGRIDLDSHQQIPL